MRWQIFSALSLLAGCAYSSPGVANFDFGPRQFNDQRVRSELERFLSPEAELIFPNDVEWANATSRWTPYRDPHFNAVVAVATTKDVQRTVAFAHKYKIPFLARNRGHGSVGSLEKLQYGIQINLEKLNKIEVHADKGYATMGGSVYTWEVIQKLYAAGKQSSTGSCSCVGLLGAGLGGGHGRLQGMHGLIADNIIAADVVLANGTLVHTSETERPDLLWALRGAGHNFGIVTEFQYKVHDLVDDGNWWTATYTYSRDQIRPVMEELNRMREYQTNRLTIAALYVWPNPQDPVPQLLVSLNYNGKIETRQSWADAFEAMNPLTTEYTEAQWHDLAETQFNGLNGFLCSFGQNRNQYSLGLKDISIETALETYDVYAELGEKYPGVRQGSQLIWEIYPLEYYQSIPSESTAYPHRDSNIIMLFHGVYEDSALDPVVRRYGERLREILQRESGFDKLQAYVNYAQGDEKWQDLYGWEEWRQKKLKTLKRKYDPTGDFSWYQPIPLR